MAYLKITLSWTKVDQYIRKVKYIIFEKENCINTHTDSGTTCEFFFRKLYVCDDIPLVLKSLGQKQLTASFKAEDDMLGHTITQGPKTVDVPASLPTPPHNNQEELR